MQDGPVVLRQSDPFACRSILQFFKADELHGLIIYAHFYKRNLKCIRTPLTPVVRIDNFMGHSSRNFHLLLVIHKFFHNQNVRFCSRHLIFQAFHSFSRFHFLLLQLPGYSSTLNKSSAFAEAILLPYKLVLQGKYQDIQYAKVSEEHEHGDDIPCLITFTEAIYHGCLVRCNISSHTLMGEEGLTRILLEFNSGSMNKYQVHWLVLFLFPLNMKFLHL